MRILLVATRHPYGRTTGRKVVLKTIIRSCLDLGHDVRVVAITDESQPPGPVPVEVIAPPGLPRVAVNVMAKASTGKLCLNECLYVSPAITAAIREVCATTHVDVVIADMVRTSSLALATGLPTVVDLDDLLSRRYAALAEGRAEAGTVLGYYGRMIPRVVRRVASRLAARLVGVEARLVSRREEAVGRAAGAVSLVAEDEAAAFTRSIGRPVAWLPMAIDIPPEPAPVASNDGRRIVFVGGLDYHANLEAVRMYVDQVAPSIAALGVDGLRLRVIGHCPEPVRVELGSSSAVELVGYVDDLASELAGARAFVAPIPPGTGVKTKVLEAMAAGLPVVSTPDGVHGIGAVDGHHCIIGSTGDELARGVVALVGDPGAAADMGAAARALVEEVFSPVVVAERWRAVLESLPLRSEPTQ